MNTMKTAIFPGSFDPFTIGHYDVVRRALQLFDKIIIGIGTNATKQPVFSVEERLKQIEETFRNDPRVEVQVYDSLTGIVYCPFERIGAGSKDP